MAKDIYIEMKKELDSLWKILREASRDHSPGYRGAVDRKISKVNDLALKIGGKALADFDELKSDIDRFLKGELSADEVDQMFRDALKLKQDTREL